MWAFEAADLLTYVEIKPQENRCLDWREFADEFQVFLRLYTHSVLGIRECAFENIGLVLAKRLHALLLDAV